MRYMYAQLTLLQYMQDTVHVLYINCCVTLMHFPIQSTYSTRPNLRPVITASTIKEAKSQVRHSTYMYMYAFIHTQYIMQS